MGNTGTEYNLSWNLVYQKRVGLHHGLSNQGESLSIFFGNAHRHLALTELRTETDVTYTAGDNTASNACSVLNRLHGKQYCRRSCRMSTAVRQIRTNSGRGRL